MKNSTKFILFLLISLHFLCMPYLSSSAECCETKSCWSKSSSILSIKFPFYLKDDQPESCGCQGFELYCDDELGLLLDHPSAGNFTVEHIDYYSRTIQLSNPKLCLPQKLLSLDSTTTPFQRLINPGMDRLYNCTGVDYHFKINEIDCLRGFNYTVISAAPSVTVSDPNCKLLTYVPSSTTDDSLVHESTSYSSSTYLTWVQGCMSCVEPIGNDSPATSKQVTIGLVVATIIVIAAIILGSCLHRLTHRNNESAMITNNTSASTPGLDQVTIDSYPMVVLGESGRLINPDDDMCPICLSEYSSKDTLKILPECLHHFHASCIDQWLRSKAICPICRTSPPFTTC